MKKRVLLFGAGGHCRSVIDVIRAVGTYEIVGIIGLREEIGKEIDDIKVVADDSQIENWLCVTDECLITVGQIGRPKIRKLLWDNLRLLNQKMATVVSPFAYVSPYASLSPGVVVMHHALVNAGATIGENCIINTKALIEHDSFIAAHCHISTGAVVNGMCQIGHSSFLGSGSVVHHTLNIADESIIKAGEVINGR